MLLLPTSAQNVQVGPVSKSGLSWLSDPKWLFTCQFQVVRWLQDPISSVPSSLFSDMSPLILFCYFTPAVVGSQVFSRTSQACFCLPALCWICLLYLHCVFPDPPDSLPHLLLRLCSNVSSTYLSLPWLPFKKFNLPPLHLDILNLNLSFLPSLNCHNTAILRTM